MNKDRIKQIFLDRPGSDPELAHLAMIIVLSMPEEEWKEYFELRPYTLGFIPLGSIYVKNGIEYFRVFIHRPCYQYRKYPSDFSSVTGKYIFL